MFDYGTTDGATMVGYLLADIFLVVFTVCMIWGMFLR